MAETHTTMGQDLRRGAAFEFEGQGAIPLIRREGIDWSGGVDGKPLSIRLCFENPAYVATSPSVAHVGVAAFGAFLPWRPLTTVSVPSLPPGGRIVLTATAHEDVPEPDPAVAAAFLRMIGSPKQSRVMHLDRLRRAVRDELTGRGGQLKGMQSGGNLPATAREDQPAPDPAAAAALRRKIRSAARSGGTTRLDQPRRPRFLPLTESGGQLKPEHFVGNLNVFVTRGETVERHQNRSIGLRPDRANIVFFAVGDRTEDHYSFHLDADSGWEVELSRVEWDAPIRWTRAYVEATITPPAGVTRGRVAIRVHRRSTDEEVPVEFDLAVDAKTLACGSI